MAKSKRKGIAASWMALAAHLGISNPTLTKYRHASGSPQTRNIKDWETFAAGQSRQREDSMSPKAKAALRKILAEAEKAEIANAKERKEWWPASKVKEEINGCIAELDAEIKALIADLPGRLLGMTIPEMVPIIEGAWEGARQRIYGGRLQKMMEAT